MTLPHSTKGEAIASEAYLSRKPKAVASAMQGCCPKRYLFSPSIWDRAASFSSSSMLMSASDSLPSPCTSLIT